MPDLDGPLFGGAGAYSTTCRGLEGLGYLAADPQVCVGVWDVCSGEDYRGVLRGAGCSACHIRQSLSCWRLA
jgi:hypothetical protein